MYIAADKSNFNEALSNSQEESIFTTLGKICRSVNLQLVPIRMSGLKEIPEDAAGFMIIGSKYDLSPQEAEVLQRVLARPNAASCHARTPAGYAQTALFGSSVNRACAHRMTA